MEYKEGSIAITKRKTKQFLDKPSGHTKAKIKRRISALKSLLAQLEEFVPWPALHDSFRMDIRELESILDKVKSNA